MALYSERPARSVMVNGVEHPFENSGNLIRIAVCESPTASIEIHV
jgi:hypothetical protein